MTVKDPIIRVMDVHKSFGEKRVLKGVNLDIARGKITTIIGGSGSGKSVLIKHIIGLLKADKGKVLFEGNDLTPMGAAQLGALRHHYGMLFQHSALFDSMNVQDNIMFPLREHTKLSRKKMQDIVSEKLRLLSLEGIEKQFPSELSGGMRKRVGLARAIVLNPKVIIYDEPTTGLDPIMTMNVDAMIKETQEKLKVTSVVISHDMASTFRISDNIAMIYDGTIREFGTREVILNSAKEEVKLFLAASSAPRSVEEDGGGEL
jgi:phospholipid/cholesterol/gamma-HCH transport system ATP-binding protein